MPQADLKASGERVADALRRTLADERGRWLLGPQQDAQSELRLRTSARATYIVDRSSATPPASSGWWTGRPAATKASDLEGFLDNEQARYAPQLERYAAALKARRLGLYFPSLARWREWEPKK